MITPSKFVTLQQSILGRLPIVLSVTLPLTISELYLAVESSFSDINEFIYALDALYVLGKIDVDFESGVICNAI